MHSEEAKNTDMVENTYKQNKKQKWKGDDRSEQEKGGSEASVKYEVTPPTLFVNIFDLLLLLFFLNK